MGKKPKTAKGAQRAARRKVVQEELPAPLKPVEDEVGSSKPMAEPSLPGNSHKVIGDDGYDDGGVADLSMLIDLDDTVQRRRRGENEYFTAAKLDILPRSTRGPMAHTTRRDQKVALAQLLFAEDEDNEDKSPAEVWADRNLEDETDEKLIKQRTERLQSAKAALRLSLVLRESAAISLSLTEICKRYLGKDGKKGADDGLRVIDKAIEITGEGFFDTDEVSIEADETPALDPKFEKNATTPCLANPEVLKFQSIRVSHLCLRSAYFQRGNCLAAKGMDEEARETYLKIIPLIENEPRCVRIDWERLSLYLNIGNTHSRQGNFELADEQYKKSEQLGIDHLNEAENVLDGKNMVSSAKRARAIALQKMGKVDEAKELMKEVVEQQIEARLEAAKKKAEEEAKKAEEEAAAGATKDENGKQIEAEKTGKS